jgi:hypothetical protein
LYQRLGYDPAAHVASLRPRPTEVARFVEVDVERETSALGHGEEKIGEEGASRARADDRHTRAIDESQIAGCAPR